MCRSEFLRKHVRPWSAILPASPAFPKYAALHLPAELPENDSLDYRGDYYFSKRSQQESLPVRPHHTVMLGDGLTERPRPNTSPKRT